MGTPLAPNLRFAGPQHESLYLIIRYANDGQVIKTVHRRLELDSEPVDLLLGYAGIQVFAAVPTAAPVTITIMDGDEVLAQKTSTGKEVLKVQYMGAESDFPDDGFVPPRLLPDANETKVLNQILEALRTQNTQQIVSTDAASNIEWETLDPLAALLAPLLSPVKGGSDFGFEGWLSWAGNYGARVFQGPFPVERGQLIAPSFGGLQLEGALPKLTLVIIDGELFDLTVDGVGLGDWFVKPSSDTRYVNRSQRLAELLLGSADEATLADVRNLFGAKQQVEVTIPRLAKLRDSLQAKYGSSISRMSPVTSANVSATAWDSVLRVDFASGKQCLLRSTFDFTVTSRKPGKGRLTAIDFVETWPSAAPNMAALASEVLAGLEKNSWELSWFHRSVHPLLDVNELHGSWQQQLQSHSEKPTFQADLSTWSVEQNDQFTSAFGVVKGWESEVEIRLDFCGDRLVAVRVMGPDVAWQSSIHVRNAERYERTATQFWSSILSSQFEEAHQLLEAGFRDRLKLEELKDMAKTSGLANVAEQSISVDQILISTRLDRGLENVVTVYLVAMIDQQPQPLRVEICETSQGLQVFGFESGFQAAFVVEEYQRFYDLIEILQSGKPGQLLPLLDPIVQKRFQPELFNAFLTEFRNQWSAAALQRTRCNHNIRENGERFESFGGRLAEDCLLTALYRWGKLLEFRVESERSLSIVDKVPTKFFEEAVHPRIVGWIEEGDLEPLVELVDPSINSSQFRRHCQSIKSEWSLALGNLVETHLEGIQIDKVSSAIELNYELKFEAASTKLTVRLQANAFTFFLIEVSSLD